MSNIFHRRSSAYIDATFSGSVGIARHKVLGQVFDRRFAVDVVNAPDAVELLVGPRRVRWLHSKSGSQLRNVAVMPGHEHNLASIFSAEERRRERRVILVQNGAVDREMKGLSQWGDCLDRAIGMLAQVGGEDHLRSGQVGVSSAEDEKLRKEAGPLKTGGREVNPAIGKLFGVTDDKDGRGRLARDGNCRCDRMWSFGYILSAGGKTSS